MGGLFTTSKKLTGGGVPPFNSFVLGLVFVHRHAISREVQLETGR